MRPPRFFVAMFVSLIVLVSTGRTQTVQTITSFSSSTGQYPGQVLLVQGRDGRMYGTATQGGLYNYGTIFKQRTVGTGNVVLYNFTGGTDGAYPEGGLTLARSGEYYGTAIQGGSTGKGVLFKITSAGVLTVLYTFTGGADGADPFSPPIEGSDGSFYGTTWGLSNQPSTLYKYNPSSGTLTTIYTFDVAFAASWQPIEGTDGDLYVTALTGGSTTCGYIERVTTAGLAKVIHTFGCKTVGDGPFGPLTQTVDGSFYGTTVYGGAYNAGTIFKLDGKTHAFTVLYSFGATTGDGLAPEGGLVQATDGNFYGSTVSGGSVGYGSLFQLTPAGVYSQLYSFPVVSNVPYQAPVAPTQDTSGIFYGATQVGGSNGLGSVYTLNMGLGPFIGFVRAQGKTGATAQILGQGLTGTTGVTFNGVAATSFKIVSDAYMTAIVPSGATTGPVVVTTPGGPLTSNVSFRIIN